MFFALLFKFQHLLRQIFVGGSNLALRIVGVDALSFGADLLSPDGVRNLRNEYFNFGTVGFPQQGADLFCKVGAPIHHRQQDAVNLRFGIDLPPHFADGLQQLFQSFGGQILRLDGNQYPVGGCQCINREHTQGGLAVN